MEILVDGVKYAPVLRSVGVAISTRNRPEVLARSLGEWEKHLPKDAVVVVVDDASQPPAAVPSWVKLIRSDVRGGVARTKNLGIAALVDAGCTELFLVDDDTFPISDQWADPYIASPEPHLMMCWGEKNFENDGLCGYQHPNGCMLYVERRVIDRVGGFDEAFPRHEHVNFSDRVHNAGLTTLRYGDVSGSDKLFCALDKDGEVESSFSESDRHVGYRMLRDNRYSSAFKAYRSERDESRFDLTVLVPSVSSRRSTFAPKIAEQVFGQWDALPERDRYRVEVLMCMDTRSRVLGDKRNQMVRLAQGRYVAQVDDDDRLEPTYLSELLEATKSGADVLTFDVSVSLNGGKPMRCVYSLDFEKDENTSSEYHRLPNHIMAVRRDLALQVPFKSLDMGEDNDWAKRVRPLLHTQHTIGKTLYHYDYSEATTETQRKDQEDAIVSSLAPSADVVILSKATTPQMRQMTQHAIDTCRENAGDKLRVNVIVIEQVEDVSYRDAITLHDTRDFAYNRSMNLGARSGFAPWIVFANNDLDFGKNWLSELLKANHQVVSPVNPGDTRQANVRRNEKGVVNGKHFSGWCFMMKRTLWEKIGGLDEDFVFWCADDCVIEQVRRVGVLPMLVPTAKVKHLRSKTIGDDRADETGALTWAMVHKFEKKYGVKKFEGNTAYAAWKRKYAHD